MKRFVPLPLLKMFTENELGVLLAGPGDIDPDEWERCAAQRSRGVCVSVGRVRGEAPTGYGG